MEKEITTLFQVIVMAVVQGIAEFLPISSSGHLLLLGKKFALPDVFTLSILLHAGTLLSVLVFFAKDLWKAVFHRPRTIGLVILGSIPTAIIGIAIVKYAKFLETSRLTTGICFLITAALLITVVKRYGQKSEYELYFEEVARNSDDPDDYYPEPKTAETTSWLDAFIVGIFQGIAALPGISRSGSTIAFGLLRGFSREWAAEFSFFLSIPVIGGAALLEILKIARHSENGLIATIQGDGQLGLYFIGAGVSFVVGMLSLFALMKMLKAGKLHYFAYWLFLVGIGTIAWTVSDHWQEVLNFFGNSGVLENLAPTPAE